MKKRNIKIIKSSSRIATCMFALICAGICAGCSLPPEPEEKQEEYSNTQVLEESGLEEEPRIIEIEKSAPVQDKAETEGDDIETITVADKEKEEAEERKETEEKKETKEKKETEERKGTEEKAETVTEDKGKVVIGMEAQESETKTVGSMITGTFSRNEGGVVIYPAYQTEDGQQIMITLDMNAQLPVWKGYERDVLHIVGLEEDKYRITGAAWAGESYWGVETNSETNLEEAVEYRDVVYSYEAR